MVGQTILGGDATLVSNKDLSRALTLQHELEIASEDLGSLENAMTPQGDTIKKVLVTLKATTTTLDGLIRKSAAPTLYTTRRNSVFPAGKVFAIPELLELILSNLGTFDLLNVLGTCKAMKVAVDTSVLLQRKMGLQAAEADSFIQLPLERRFNNPIDRMYPITSHALLAPQTPGFSCTGVVHTTEVIRRAHLGFTTPNAQENAVPPKKETLDIYMSLDLSHAGKLPVVGSRCRSMLLCNPPIYKMKVVPSCCAMMMERFPNWPPALGGMYNQQPPPRLDKIKLENPDGICVGDVLDLVEGLMKEHRTCPNAYEEMLDDDGYVQPSFSMRGRAPLQDRDPYLLAEQKVRAHQKEAHEKRNERNAKMDGLCKARRDARDAGDYVPTLAEFLASKERPEGPWTEDDVGDDDDSYYGLQQHAIDTLYADLNDNLITGQEDDDN